MERQEDEGMKPVDNNAIQVGSSSIYKERAASQLSLSRAGGPQKQFHVRPQPFFWKALLLIRITQNGRRPAPYGAHRNWTYRD